jgi:hypothetical protein
MHTFWSENLKGRNHLDDLVVDGRIILKWILKEPRIRVWTGFICLTIRTTAFLCDHGNECWDSIKAWYFFSS